ncbi:hypothetical protein CYMTET_48010 [Cymbomonas tetramitiformis]|uniref:Uncharacterized protein n=1 Tax=Cymbomonas tetramitiformis TaxID=36881 RepID=A0AAE0EX59_9CHLO|nr:hypothetical protein CYMTET_48010 [Cymbomonas tetramitiformis]
MSAHSRPVSAAARRSLATIFDDTAVRHATTPATPLVTAAPAASSAAAAFLANVKSLARDHFDEKVAKIIIRKVYEEKTQRFIGGESNVNSVFAKLVLALRTAFTTEEAAFGTLFDLEDATLLVRAEADRLLFSTLELIIHPTSPAADCSSSGSCNGRATKCYSQHSASGTANGFAVTEEVSAHAYSEKSDFKLMFSGVQDMLYDMKREIKSINTRMDATKGFTPRGEKYGRGPKRFRVGAEPLAHGGNTSQSTVNKKVAFHKGTGEFVPLCRNGTCAAAGAKHWHRDCPHGGPNTLFDENDILM